MIFRFIICLFLFHTSANSASRQNTRFYRFSARFLLFFALVIYNYMDWQMFIAFYTTLFRVVNTEIKLLCCIYYKNFSFNSTICGVILG